MFSSNRQLLLDSKVQDRLREFFAQRGSSKNVVITALGLGDSDVDYELSDQVNNIRILNAPYNVSQIKHKLVFSGNTTNITGKITTFLRQVQANGSIKSLYNYPPNTTFVAGIIPPKLVTGLDFNSITFDSTSFQGYIVYFQTLPDNYFDENNVPQRLVESYLLNIENVPFLTISNVTATSPIVITTAANHLLLNGAIVKISGVKDNTGILTEANGTFYANNVTATTFELFFDAGFASPVTGTSSYLIQNYSVSDASNTSPITITTTTLHNLTSGSQVAISGVTGNANANGLLFYVKVTGLTTFQLYSDSGLGIPVNGSGVYSGSGTVTVGTGTVTIWEVIVDKTNNSLLISKTKRTLEGSLTSIGRITVHGLLSGLEKTITFNY